MCSTHDKLSHATATKAEECLALLSSLSKTLHDAAMTLLLARPTYAQHGPATDARGPVAEGDGVTNIGFLPEHHCDHATSR